MTDEELKRLMQDAAEKGADLALRKLTSQVYQDVGRTVVKRFVEGLGMLIVAFAIFAIQQGWFK
jgi:hypothetical protein